MEYSGTNHFHGIVCIVPPVVTAVDPRVCSCRVGVEPDRCTAPECRIRRNYIAKNPARWLKKYGDG